MEDLQAFADSAGYTLQAVTSVSGNRHVYSLRVKNGNEVIWQCAVVGAENEQAHETMAGWALGALNA